MLVNNFNAALQDVSDVTRDPYLAKLGTVLAAVEAAIPAISEIKSYETALNNLISKSGSPISISLLVHFGIGGFRLFIGFDTYNNALRHETADLH